MTLSTTSARVTYAGNGVLTSFGFAFNIWATSDLKVYLRDTTTKVDTLQTETTHYSVTGTFPGAGNVVFVTPPATGKTVVIVRDRSVTQDLDLIASGTFAADNIEIQLDKIVAFCQAAREILTRVPTIPIGNSVGNWPLPEPVANAAVVFASDGLSLTTAAVSSFVPGAIVTTAFTQSLLDDADAAAARTTLGIGAAKFASVGYLTGSAVIDFASVVDNAVSATSNVTVTGAVAGDFVVGVSASGNIDTTNGITLCAKVTAADTVGVFLINDSGGAFDAASQTIRVLVIPRANVGL